MLTLGHWRKEKLFTCNFSFLHFIHAKFGHGSSGRTLKSNIHFHGAAKKLIRNQGFGYFHSVRFRRKGRSSLPQIVLVCNSRLIYRQLLVLS